MHKELKNRFSLLKKIMYNFIIIVFSLLITFLIGEFWVRYYCDPIPGIHSCIMPVEDNRHYVMKPNNTFVFNGIYEKLRYPVTWQTNSLGERAGASILRTKSNRPQIKVATYGDSEIFGWGLKLEETFQKRMEQMEPNMTVNNFGVPGYNVCQVAEHAVKTKLSEHPDYLLYVINPNDFDVSLVFNQFPKSSELLKRLVFVYYVLKKKKAQKLRRSEEVTKIFSDELVKMKSYCEQNKIEFVVAFLE